MANREMVYWRKGSLAGKLEWGFSNNVMRILVSVVAVLVMTGLVMTGCSSSLTNGQQAPAVTARAMVENTPANNEPDLRIISLDFSPPINEDGTCEGLANRALLVAVDNRGGLAVNDVEVGLKISDPSGRDGLVSQSQTISSLASGEIRVLKFNNLGVTQKQSSYLLDVNVKPVVGEQNIEDNHKSVILRLTGS